MYNAAVSLLHEFHKIADAVMVGNTKTILNLLELNKAAKVLDMGCGDGSLTKMIGEKIDTQNLFGIEVEEELVRLCKENGVRTIRANLNEKLPLDSESFDVVTANHVLEHLFCTDLFIKEVYRVLKRGGYAVISTPNLTTWHNILCIILGYQLFGTTISDEINVGNPWSPNYRKPCGGVYATHHRVFTLPALKELFSWHGFEIQTIVGVGYFPFSAWVARFLTRLDSRHAMYLNLKVRKT